MTGAYCGYGRQAVVIIIIVIIIIIIISLFCPQERSRWGTGPRRCV